LTSIVDVLEMIVAKRWRLMLALFLLELAAIFIVSNSPFFPGEQTTYQNQYNSIKPVLNQSALGQVASIFENNLRVAIFEMLPGIGPFVFAFSIYETARIVEVIGITNTAGAPATLATLFFLPSTWLELPAYAMAVAESIYLILGFRNFVQELWTALATLVMIAVTLVVAATVEVTEIQIETMYATSPDAALVFLTWIPFAIIVAAAVRFWRKARRDLPRLEQGSLQTVAGTGEAQLPVVITPGVVRYCPTCGKAYPGSPKFCAGCGSLLPAPSQQA